MSIRAASWNSRKMRRTLEEVASAFHALATSRPSEEAIALVGLKHPDGQGPTFPWQLVPITNVRHSRSSFEADSGEWIEGIRTLGWADYTVAICCHSHRTGYRPSPSDIRHLADPEWTERVTLTLEAMDITAPMLFLVLSEASGRWGLYRMLPEQSHYQTLAKSQTYSTERSNSWKKNANY